MKTLYILRHAKSSWNDNAIADFDRPLNERGSSAAPFMGELMASRGIKPELIISSPAKRAMQTAGLVKEAAGLNSPIKYDERIYEATVETLKMVLSQIGNEPGSAMIVGHNPGMEGLIRLLTGRIEPMPTAALASIDMAIEGWDEIAPGCGELLFVIRPREEMKPFGQK